MRSIILIALLFVSFSVEASEYQDLQNRVYKMEQEQHTRDFEERLHEMDVRADHLATGCEWSNTCAE